MMTPLPCGGVFYYDAVLLAIAIPVFTTQLEKSCDYVTVSNLRAAYALAAAGYLTDDGIGHSAGDVAVAAPADGKVVVTVANVSVEGIDTTVGKALSNLESGLPFTVSDANAQELNKVTGKKGAAGTVTITFTYTVNSSAEPTFGFPAAKHFLHVFRHRCLPGRLRAECWYQGRFDMRATVS